MNDECSEFRRLEYKSSSGHVLPYWLRMTEFESGKKYPVLIHLHGAGSWDNDDTACLVQAKRVSELLGGEIIIIVPKTYRPVKWADLDWNQTEHKMQPPTAAMSSLIELTENFLSENKFADTERVYINGQSMGGFGTWDFLCRRPDLFAAAVPVCGGADISFMPALKNMPVWIFHGAKDMTVPAENSRRLYKALLNAGAEKVKYTEYPDVEHNAWDKTYENKELKHWLFSQRKEK